MPNAPTRWNPSASREVRTTARPKWQEIRKALGIAVAGHACFGVLAAVGVALLAQGGPVARRMEMEPEEVTLLGWGLVALGGLVGYLLVLWGQWRCLVYAQQAYSAKDLQFAALLAWLVAPACFGLAHLLGGGKNFAVLARGPAEWTGHSLLQGGAMIQLAGAAIGLVSVLLFSGFAHAVRRSLGEGERGAAAFFWAVAFLVGGSAGVLLHARDSTWPQVGPSLALGWLLCLLWHTLLLRGAASSVAQSLRRRSGVVPAVGGACPGLKTITFQNGTFFHDRGGSNTPG